MFWITFGIRLEVDICEQALLGSAFIFSRVRYLLRKTQRQTASITKKIAGQTSKQSISTPDYRYETFYI